MIKVVIDTCVVLDVLQKREPFFHDAVKIFYAAASDQIEGILTAKSITDLFYIHHRFTHDNEATRGILRKLTELFTIADTAAADCHEALIKDHGDFEDAVMMETAERIKADCIVTRNTKDYIESKVTALDPKSFVTTFLTDC